MKNSSDAIGNRTRNLPTYSVVPQPTVLPRATFEGRGIMMMMMMMIIIIIIIIIMLNL